MLFVVFLIYSAVVLYSAFNRTKKEKRHPLSFKILMTCFAVIPWVGLLTGSGRIIVLIIVLLMLADIISVFYYNIVKKERYKILEYLVAWYGLLLGVSILDLYTFANEPTNIHFWIPSVVLSVLAIILYTAYLIINSRKKQSKFTISDFGKVVLAALYTFFVVWTSICNLNFALDFSKPEKYSIPIIDKYEDISLVSQGVVKNSNIIVVEISGKNVKMLVSAQEYDRYQKGDCITIDKYKGFFNDPYFIIE